METYENIIDGLKDVRVKSKNLGDSISSISELTDDVEMKAIITDLANSAYNLAMDIGDAAETYAELQQNEAENMDDEELEPSEPEEEV